jgi:hypothetical protein
MKAIIGKSKSDIDIELLAKAIMESNLNEERRKEIEKVKDMIISIRKIANDLLDSKMIDCRIEYLQSFGYLVKDFDGLIMYYLRSVGKHYMGMTVFTECFSRCSLEYIIKDDKFIILGLDNTNNKNRFTDWFKELIAARA